MKKCVQHHKDVSNKKILFFVNALYAGAGKVLLFVAESCVKFGWNVTVITLYDEQISRYHNTGIDFKNLDIKMDSPLWRLQALRKIREIARKKNARVICAFVSDVVFMSRLATLGMQGKFVSAERGDPYTLPMKWVLPVKWAYRRSDYAIFQLEHAQKFFGVNINKKSAIIPNPYSTGKPLIPYKGEREKTIVSAGRFVEQKGYDILIKAFALFSERHPDYRLIIYGDGPLKEDLVNEAKKLKIINHIEFPGFIDDVQASIKKCSIFVLSSRFEGIPNTLIEAMSIGVPTVSTDCSPGGPRYLTNNGERGLLVPVDDFERMASALSTIIENKEIAETLSIKGLEIKSELDPEIIRSKWMGVFDSLY